MPLPSETIALPLIKGLDLQTDARLVPAPALLEAENTQFSGGGAKKRVGHTEYLVRTEDTYRPEADSSSPGPGMGDWPVDYGTLTAAQKTYTYGYGLGGETFLREALRDEDIKYLTSPYPEIGYLHGAATRDDETLLWDGFRLLSYPAAQGDSQSTYFTEVGRTATAQATFPALSAHPLAKFAERQAQPGFADNLVTKIMAWKSGSTTRYAIYDSTSGALLSQGTLAATPNYLRCFTLGTWMHVLVLDSSDGLCKLFSIQSTAVSTVNYRSCGPATHFDLWKSSDAHAILARSNPSGIDITWIGTDGGGHVGAPSINWIPSLSGAHTLVAVAETSMAVDDGYVGVVAYNPTQDRLSMQCFVSATGAKAAVSAGDATDTVSLGALQRLTIAPKYVATYDSSRNEPYEESEIPPFDVYFDDGSAIGSRRFWSNGGLNSGAEYIRYGMVLASRAWRVGDRTFFWAGHDSNAQATWVMLDESLLPVGKMDFGTANVDGISTNGYLSGVNFPPGYGYDDETRVQLALDAKLRVAENDSTIATASVYTEPFPKAVALNFYPTLRSAQAGRTLYIAGAQLWTYDGLELTEAGFHWGPDVTVAQAASGSLTALGTYSYRVDVCHRNAQNEEVRSVHILTTSLELTGSNQTINLTIPTVLTRRSDSYFLIYRNAMSSGTPLANWWLLNSRDPGDASYLANNLSVASVSYSDTGAVSDVAIQSRELHPASDTYLQPVSAPACEIIASGRDRLWLAGGELPPGKVAPSRLFEPGETASFNPYLELQVDRSNEPITAVGFVGDVAIIFRRNSTYLLDSDGPDNNASGTWNPPRLALADTGAVSQASVLRTSNGLMFQSPAGFRVVGPGGALTPLMDIDRVAKDFEVMGAVLNEKYQEARFYDEEGCYVYNYLYGTWAHWTCGGVGVVKRSNGLVAIAREDGRLWLEDESVFMDGDNMYSQRIRTSWLHGGNLGDFQRVRRVGALGRFADLTNMTHNLRLEFYYDERDFWEERVEWTMPDSTVNSDTFGAATYGAGVFGDTSATIKNLEDLTWEWVRRPSRQKCSVFSVMIEDHNTSGPGFELSAFTLELARKQGLNRVPERTGTGSYR